MSPSVMIRRSINAIRSRGQSMENRLISSTACLVALSVAVEQGDGVRVGWHRQLIDDERHGAVLHGGFVEKFERPLARAVTLSAEFAH